MEALLETTVWDGGAVNHTYLLDGSNLVAYLQHGKTVPFYFKNPIKQFNKRGRTFIRASIIPFKVKQEVHDHIKIVAGSKPGVTYSVNTEEKTCTCLGYTFRGTCKHLDAV